jgi:putative ABC transport system permease protein
MRIASNLGHDLRGAVRRLVRTPVLSALAIVTIALGVGANTSLFSVLNAVALRPLPVVEPERLVAISRQDPKGQSRWMPLATATALAGAQHSLDAWCGYAGNALFTADVHGSFEKSVMEFMTGQCYVMLGARPAVGRLLSPADVPSTGEPAPVAVIGFGFWQRAFNGDPKVVGQSIRVEGVPLTIVGVTERGFSGLLASSTPDITLPATTLPRFLKTPTTQVSHLVGRLRPGVTLVQARDELVRLWPAVREATAPQASAAARSAFLSQRLLVEAAGHGFFNDRDTFASLLYRLIAFSGALLVLACANLAGFLLARSASRSHEFAVRRALGATTGHLVRDCLVEGLVLSIGGAVVALPATWATSAWLGRMLLARDRPPSISFAPDFRVLTAAAAATVLTGLAIGLFSARAAARSRALLAGAHPRSTANLRVGGALVVPQVALAVVLLFGSGLVTRSLFNLGAADTGFRPEHLALAPLFAQPAAPSEIPSPDTYYPSLLQDLSALPGVESAALARLFPRLDDETTLLQPAGARPDGPQVQVARDVVSPGLFATAGIRVTKGRDFTWHDGPTAAPVAVINATLARRLFPNGDAVGSKIALGADERRRELEVVGVVADVTLGNVRRAHVPTVFRPVLQETSFARYASVIVRTRAGSAPGDLAAGIAKTVRARGLDYVDSVRGAGDQLSLGLSRDRLSAELSAAFALLATLVSFLGLQGLLACIVAMRTREFGIRLAVGASRRRVLLSVLGRGLALTAAGLLIGLPCALAAGRMAESLLFGLSSSDAPTLVGSSAAILAVGALAGLAPAWRASRGDPAEILREGQ